MVSTDPEPQAELEGGSDPALVRSLAELIAGLSRPAAFGVTAAEVEVVQTHISVVFLVGDRAYKLKKPACFWGLVDYSTAERREHYCHEEVRLNRRLAPDVYLGVEPVVLREGALYVGGAGQPVDHVVVMRRVDESQSLGALIERGAAGAPEVREVAAILAAFHAAHRLDPVPDVEDIVDAFGDVLRQNFAGTPVDDNALFPPAVHRGLETRLLATYEGLRETCARRVERGLAVDGHRDIRLEHVLREDAGWIIMDCVEFSPALRRIDPAADLAFLSMDLVMHGRADLSAELEAAYATAAGDSELAELAPFLRADWAYVRASVDFHTQTQPEVEAAVRTRKAASAQRHFALAWTESRHREVPPIIVLRGFSGTGKSRVASAIADPLNAEILRSDVIRKELAGLAETERTQGAAQAALYSSDMSARTYAELLQRARHALRAGRAAILDATYLRAHARAEAEALARELGAPYAVLELTCPQDVVRERLVARAARDDDASDAGYEVYLAQRAEDEPLSEGERAVSVTHDTREAAEPALMALLDVLDAQARDGAR